MQSDDSLAKVETRERGRKEEGWLGWAGPLDGAFQHSEGAGQGILYERRDLRYSVF
jgi:hypothetical protein